QPANLGEKRMRVDDDAVSDHRQLTRTHDTRGQQGQFVADSVDDQSMPGIVAALETNDDIGALGKPVDNLALALVAPLGADHHYVRHVTLSCFCAISCARSIRRIYKA